MADTPTRDRVQFIVGQVIHVAGWGAGAMFITAPGWRISDRILGALCAGIVSMVGTGIWLPPSDRKRERRAQQKQAAEERT